MKNTASKELTVANVTRCVTKPHGWELDIMSSFLMINQFIFVTVGYQASLFHVISANSNMKYSHSPLPREGHGVDKMPTYKGLSTDDQC